MFGGAGLEFWAELGGLDQPTVNAVVSRAVEGGINFIDTADGYADGRSEICVGTAIRELKLNRADIIVCTKGGMPMGAGPNAAGSSRAHLIQACESSLKRLGTDYIDLYLVHMFDPVTPLDETLRALDDLIRAGKLRYVGCANFAAWEVMKALAISDRERLVRFEVVQSNWSIATRDVEREILPLARAEHVGIMAWGALLGGVLSGKYSRDKTNVSQGRRGGRIAPVLDAGRVHDIVDVMRGIAAAHGVTPAEIALAFLLYNPEAASVIFGATRPAQVDANLRASELVFSQTEVESLNRVSALSVDYGRYVTQPGRDGRAQYL